MGFDATSSAGAVGPWGRTQNLILPVAMIASILVVLLPLPAALMDVLLSANIAIAAIVLLTTISVRTPLEFSVFPSLLLATTLYRLVLNVATTRLILTRGQTEGLWAAGGVIKTFGEFVAGDRVVVGLVIFAIIALIQFIVITKGATRISEVAARFALDGMPGRQMAIDADLNAGAIDEREAQRRRSDVARQADFFGAMDGAGKFVRGDAIAAMAIVAINLVGGFAIGVFEGRMDLAQAASIFAKLAIGDGLASQVPAFLISLSAGLLVTRSSQESSLPNDVIRQLFFRPQVLAVAGAFLGMLVFTELPRIPLLLIGGGCVALAIALTRQAAREEVKKKADQKAQADKTREERVEEFLAVNPMEIEVGRGLLSLADPKLGGDLLERLQRIRQQVASDLGILLPKVRIRDNARLESHRYRIKIADVPVAEGSVQPRLFLAIDLGQAGGPLDGIPVREPVFGGPAVWIEPAQRDRAESLGYAVVDARSVIGTHLTETVRRHAEELLTRDAAKHLLDELKKTAPAAVDSLVPGVLRLADVQQVLRVLLREGVSIRNLETIVEALGDHAPHVKNPILLAEFARRRLGRSLCAKYRGTDNVIRAVTLDPELEDRISRAVDRNDEELRVRIPPQQADAIARAIVEAAEPLQRENRPTVALVGPAIRPAVKRLTESALPQLAVLSYDEIPRDIKIESVGMVFDPAGPAADREEELIGAGERD